MNKNYADPLKTKLHFVKGNILSTKNIPDGTLIQVSNNGKIKFYIGKYKNITIEKDLKEYTFIDGDQLLLLIVLGDLEEYFLSEYSFIGNKLTFVSSNTYTLSKLPDDGLKMTLHLLWKNLVL